MLDVWGFGTLCERDINDNSRRRNAPHGLCSPLAPESLQPLSVVGFRGLGLRWLWVSGGRGPAEGGVAD